MASILCLPNEMLLMIIKEIPLLEVWRFAACCKTLHALAEADLEQHKLFRKHYADVEFSVLGPLQKAPFHAAAGLQIPEGQGEDVPESRINKATQSLNSQLCYRPSFGPVRGDSYEPKVFEETMRGDHPLMLLRDMLIDERVNQYPKHMHILDCGEDYDDPRLYSGDNDPGADAHVKWVLRDHGDTMVELAMQNRWQGPSWNGINWAERIKLGVHGPVTSLILTLLPNLERLDICWHKGLHRFLTQTLEEIAIAHLANKRTSLPAQKTGIPLSKVRHCTILSMSDFMNDHFELETQESKLLESLAMLPALEVLYIQGINDAVVSNWTRGVPLYPPRSSAVTELKISDSFLSNEGFIRLLANFGSLQKLTYQHAEWPYFPDRDEEFWMPKTRINMISDQCRFTLTHLDLTTRLSYGEEAELGRDKANLDECGPFEEGYTERYAIQQIRPFLCLKWLRLNMENFIYNCMPQPLTEMRLPPTLEHLCICGPPPPWGSENRLSYLFENMVRFKATRCPNLARVDLENLTGDNEMCQKICAIAGIDLKFRKTEAFAMEEMRYPQEGWDFMKYKLQ